MDISQNTSQKPKAVVTGASSGIGYELAKQFANNGFDLFICAEDPGIVEAAQALEGFGARVEKLQVDLRNFEDVEKFYAQIQKWGPVEALALNAGVGVSGDFIGDTELREELKLIDLNVKSVVHLAKRVAADMVNQGHGKILMTSSIASILPGPFLAVYAASKAFVQSFGEAIASELKDRGVTVTTLLPGPTDTEFFERADMMDTKAGTGKKDDPAVVAKQGFEAMMEGKDKIVAGSFMNKVQGVVGKMMPDQMAASMHRRQTEPGSAKK
ncbi:MAG: SDR family NAD(P)-dependent oxidoreductase [Pseudobdellovibrionaceae bacterium]